MKPSPLTDSAYRARCRELRRCTHCPARAFREFSRCRACLRKDAAGALVRKRRNQKNSRMNNPGKVAR